MENQEKPLIVRLLMSRDWNAAFRLVWTETFKVAAANMGLAAPAVDIVMDNVPSWQQSWPWRRAICLRMGRRCAEDYTLPELACAWTALAVDPGWPKDDEPASERATMFLPINFAVGDAIAKNPALLDDLDFARTVMGWRFMESFGVGGPEHDPVVVGRSTGSGMEIEKDELLAWARKWAAAS